MYSGIYLAFIKLLKIMYLLPSGSRQITCSVPEGIASTLVTLPRSSNISSSKRNIIQKVRVHVLPNLFGHLTQITVPSRRDFRQSDIEYYKCSTPYVSHGYRDVYKRQVLYRQFIFLHAITAKRVTPPARREFQPAH